MFSVTFHFLGARVLGAHGGGEVGFAFFHGEHVVGVVGGNGARKELPTKCEERWGRMVQPEVVAARRVTRRRLGRIMVEWLFVFFA